MYNIPSVEHALVISIIKNMYICAIGHQPLPKKKEVDFVKKGLWLIDTRLHFNKFQDIM